MQPCHANIRSALPRGLHVSDDEELIPCIYINEEDQTYESTVEEVDFESPLLKDIHYHMVVVSTPEYLHMYDIDSPLCFFSKN